MKDYSAMTDFEVNLLVAKSVLNFDQLSSTQCLNKAHVQWADGANWHKFDPCNNPADAWPIIHDEMISIVFDDEGYAMPQSAWCKATTHRGNEYCGDVRRPLRTAMIVFLMMKDEAVNTQGEKV